jgi:phenylalanyl-tRNA synthetase beta chain
MPVITFNYEDLVALIGKEVPADELIAVIPMMGADYHHFDASSGEMGIEFFPDRPDNYCVEGVARSLRNFLGLETGMKRYSVGDSGIVLTVEESVRDVRPFVVAGVVRNITITDPFIKSLMELQEKMHLTVGRRRAKVSIGIHDLDKVKAPFVYKGVAPESVSFVPLAKTEEMNLREILERHEKGVDYAYILEGKERYPVIFDCRGEVLSFPPIINGCLTAVTEETRNIFIDVTGTDLPAISGVLNIVATAMAERGGHIESVKVVEEKGTMTTPDLTPVEWDLESAYCNRWLGLDLGPEELAQCLRRMGMDAHVSRRNLKVLVPATRMDILHPVDLAEDVAKGYGYARFGSHAPETQMIGGERPIERASDLLRQLMIGYGYYEVTTLTLSSEKDQFDLLRFPRGEVVEVFNPISEDHTCLRVRLLPSLLAVLRKSKHRDLPQRIFEVGDVLDGIKRRRHLCGVAIHSKASFTEMKSLMEGLMRDLSCQATIEPCDIPACIEGRGAALMVAGEYVGMFGELHPEVITNAELGYPAIAFELDVEKALGQRLARVI